MKIINKIKFPRTEEHVCRLKGPNEYSETQGTSLCAIRTLETKRRFYKIPERGKGSYRESTIRMALEFSTVMLQTKRQSNNIFRFLKKREFQPRILYLAKFSNKRRIKTFLDMFQKVPMPLFSTRY